MTSVDQLTRYRAVLMWTFLASLPLLLAVHAPMLPSEAMPHRAYHTAESLLGPEEGRMLLDLSLERQDLVPEIRGSQVGEV